MKVTNKLTYLTNTCRFTHTQW